MRESQDDRIRRVAREAAEYLLSHGGEYWIYRVARESAVRLIYPRRHDLMRNVSKERSKQLRLYTKRVRPWLKENTHCRACAVLAEHAGVAIRVIRLADEVHHMRGRNGDLLLDERYWLPVCMGCHRWITEHGKKARELGLSADVNYR